MSNVALLSKRFGELSSQLDVVDASKEYRSSDYLSGHYVNAELFTKWQISALHLLEISCGEKSTHYAAFVHKRGGSGFSTNHETMLQLKAIFQAAREDFEGGYFNSVRNMVQAEVFSSELDQANELVKGGYIAAAAVIAGVVLETNLRRLCEDAGIEPASLNKMNADLTKAGVYNLLVNKRITALADIRNNAAHGHPDKFNKDDVVDMIGKVESFAGDHL